MEHLSKICVLGLDIAVGFFDKNLTLNWHLGDYRDWDWLDPFVSDTIISFPIGIVVKMILDEVVGRQENKDACNDSESYP